MFEIFMFILEQILLFTGILIISAVVIGVCGIFIILALAGLRALSAKLPPSPFMRVLRRVILQSIYALRECLPIVLLGVFFGASIGTAIKFMLHFTSAPLNGVVIGGILSGLFAFALITPKWGHCYLGKHDYAPESQYIENGDFLADQCMLCGKNLD